MTHLSNKFLSFFQSTKHQFFRNFLCTTFNHCETFSSSSYNDFKLTFFDLFVSWVDNIITINITNTTSCNWSVKWNIRNCNSSRRCDYSKNIRWVDLVRRNTSRNNLNFATKSHIKKWTHRTVNKTRNQDFFILWTTFSFNKSSRNFSCSIIFFVIINCYRNIIQSFLSCSRSTNCCDNS